MKEPVVLFLCILLSFNQTPLGELLKVPFLIEHFIKHKERDRTSLLAFLGQHYASEHNDSDRSEDEQLPFKDMLFQNADFVLVSFVNEPQVTIPIPLLLKPSRYNVFTPQQHLSTIFHPPRHIRTHFHNPEF